MNFLKSSILLFVLFFCIKSQAQSHKINIEIEELKDTSVILGYYYNKQIMVKDTAYTNSKGHCTFAGDSLLDQGIYVVYLPDQTYFDVLIGEDQEFKIETKKTDFIDHLKITGNEESEAFIAYQRFLISKQKEAKTLQDSIKNNEENEELITSLKEELSTLTKEVKGYWKEIEEKYPDAFITAFLRGLQEIEVPQFEAPEGASNPDSIIQRKRYYYYKDHYFDNIDMTDKRMLKTPYFTNKVDNYFTKTIAQIPDTLVKESHRIIRMTEPTPETFRYMVSYLFNMFNESKMMGMDGVMANIGEAYYLSGKAEWADSTFLSKLEDRVNKIKPNMIGKKAADFKMQAATGEFFRLYEIDAPITILVFWDPDCGHCKKELPKIKEEIWDKYYDKGLKVVTVYTQVEEEEWKEFLDEKELNEMINLYDPYNRSNFRNNYDIYSTPVIYVLDKEKHIIAKRIGLEQLPDFLDHHFERLENE